MTLKIYTDWLYEMKKSIAMLTFVIFCGSIIAYLIDSITVKILGVSKASLYDGVEMNGG